jgi:hypothetical protein
MGFEDDDMEFQNMFAKGKNTYKAGTSKQNRNQRDTSRHGSVPHHALPKIHFPKFDGNNPKIWFDNCANYFKIYGMVDEMKVTAATMHLEGNASKWWQAYKQSHAIPTWTKFCAIVQEQFGAHDYCKAMNELLTLR